VTHDQVAKLAGAGALVSLGHTDADFETCQTYFDAGAICATHLFNAMSQMESRRPGLVGAALANQSIKAGIIADGIHVHPAILSLAMRTKPGAMFLVTDAMATAASSITEFTLGGRTIRRQNGKLTLEDGTLAGADLDMKTAVGVLVESGVDQAVALAAATVTPAGLLREPLGCGALEIGKPCQLIVY
jgi:N-acetylglucosamine-6-phosphate deacetylase